MTVTYELVPGKMSTQIKLIGAEQQRVHKAQYRITNDESPYTPEAQQAFVALSGIDQFTSIPGDPLAWLSDMTVVAEATRNPWTFLANCEWSTETPGAQQADREMDDPLDDAIEIDIDGEIATLPLWSDLNGKLIANTVGDPITGLEQRRNIEIVTFTRNEAIKNTSRDRAFRGMVNYYPWNGAAKGCVLCKSITTRRHFRKRQEYWPYVYTFAYRADGWQPNILNAGLNEIRNGNRSPIKDAWGEPVTEPVPISNFSNLAIPPSALPNSAAFIQFTTFGSVDMAQLNLPSY